MTQLSSGSLSTSRIGFRGTEDLGGGLAASFWLESHLFADDGRAGSGQTAGNQVFSAAGAGLNFARRSTVSLSGPLGELRLGRDLSPSYWNLLLFDPFTTIGSGGSIMAVGALTNLGANAAVYGLGPAGSGTTGPLARTSNTISYFSPRRGVACTSKAAIGWARTRKTELRTRTTALAMAFAQVTTQAQLKPR
jgi:predicted porin